MILYMVEQSKGWYIGGAGRVTLMINPTSKSYRCRWHEYVMSKDGGYTGETTIFEKDGTFKTHKDLARAIGGFSKDARSKATKTSLSEISEVISGDLHRFKKKSDIRLCLKEKDGEYVFEDSKLKIRLTPDKIYVTDKTVSSNEIVGSWFTYRNVGERFSKALQRAVEGVGHAKLPEVLNASKEIAQGLVCITGSARGR